jgi:hypothetical protein
MQLEMLARGEFIEGMDNVRTDDVMALTEQFNPVPLLSPVLSHHAGSSYASPVAQAAFGTSGQGHSGQGQQRHDTVSANQHALERLQFSSASSRNSSHCFRSSRDSSRLRLRPSPLLLDHHTCRPSSTLISSNSSNTALPLTPGSVPTGHPGSSVNTRRLAAAAFSTYLARS